MTSTKRERNRAFFLLKFDGIRGGESRSRDFERVLPTRRRDATRHARITRRTSRPTQIRANFCESKRDRPRRELGLSARGAGMHGWKITFGTLTRFYAPSRERATSRRYSVEMTGRRCVRRNVGKKGARREREKKTEEKRDE